MPYGALAPCVARHGCRGTAQGIVPSTHYLNVPGDGFASVPDSAAVSITGNLRIRGKLQLADYTPLAVNGLVGKWVVGAAGNRSFAFRVDAAGTLSLLLSANGSTISTATSSAATGITDGTDIWLGVDWRASDGQVQFFTSTDGSTWTQLGTNQSIVIASIFDSSTLVTIGALDNTPGLCMTGRFYRAQIYSALDGTGLQLDANFAAQAPGATTFTEGSSNAATVTVVATASIV